MDLFGDFLNLSAMFFEACGKRSTCFTDIGEITVFATNFINRAGGFKKIHTRAAKLLSISDQHKSAIADHVASTNHIIDWDRIQMNSSPGERQIYTLD